MSLSKLELLRSACESVESSEHVLAIANQQKNKRKPAAEANEQAEVISKKEPASLWWDLLIDKVSGNI